MTVLIIFPCLELTTPTGEELDTVKRVEVPVQIFLGTECAGTVLLLAGESCGGWWRLTDGGVVDMHFGGGELGCR